MHRLISAIQLQSVVKPGKHTTRLILDAGLDHDQIWDAAQMSAHGIQPLPAPPKDYVQQVLQKVQKAGVQIITMWDDAYPPLLREIYAPPAVLYAKGTIPDWNASPTVAMVGTRHCSDQSVQVAGVLAQGLAAGGAIVVSGGAVGIDKAAHLGTLQANGITVDIMPCGVDVNYPAANQYMRTDIIQHSGLLLSEYPPGTPVTRGVFQLRNRLIAGISAAVCVVEAPLRSGSLITARWARDQGRDLYVVAGSLSDDRYAGSHELLREGAELLLDAAQVLQDLQGRFSGKADLDKARTAQAAAVQALHQPESEYFPPEPPLRETEPIACPSYASDAAKQMYHFLTDGALSLEELAEKAGCPVGIALSQLTELELLGCVTALPGPAYAIKETGRNR